MRCNTAPAARAARTTTLALLLGVLLATAAFAAPALAKSGTYVALGDSYTAGPLIPNQTGLPLGCLRSDHNYPALVAPSLDTAVFTDVSCSGATTDDMTSAQGVTPGPNPPQFDALDASDRAVTLGIGGNDIGFSSIIENCVNLNPFGTPCKNGYTSGGTDQITQRIQVTAPKVAAAIQGIHTRAPSAKVFVIGYPTILPDSGSGCWPVVPILPQDVPYLRSKEKELNQMLATQAAANSATYVDTYTSSIGHDVCKGTGTKWVEGLVPTSPAAPVHPNALGMAHTATVVLAAISASGY